MAVHVSLACMHARKYGRCVTAPVVRVGPDRLVAEPLVAALDLHGLRVVAAQHAPVQLRVVHVVDRVRRVLIRRMQVKARLDTLPCYRKLEQLGKYGAAQRCAWRSSHQHHHQPACMRLYMLHSQLQQGWTSAGSQSAAGAPLGEVGIIVTCGFWMAEASPPGPHSRRSQSRGASPWCCPEGC